MPLQLHGPMGRGVAAGAGILTHPSLRDRQAGNHLRQTNRAKVLGASVGPAPNSHRHADSCDTSWMTESSHPDSLLDVYDVDFLAYVLNENRDQVHQRLTDGGPLLAGEREAVLNSLFAMENSVRPQSPNQILQREIQLATYQANLGGSLIALYRRACGGGGVDISAATDEVERLLLDFAASTYPLHLQLDFNSARSPKQHYPTLAFAFINHPNNQLLQDAVMADGVLSKLYSDPSRGALRSTGQVGVIPMLMLFGDQIVNAAWHWAHFDSARPSFDEYSRRILAVIRVLKAGLRGDEALVPMRIGLAGVLLPVGMDSVGFGGARVRRADERDEYLTRSIPITGQLGTTNAQGEAVKIDYVGNLTLELDIPFKIVLRKLDKANTWSDQLRDLSPSGEPVEHLRLALILAGGGETSTVFRTWTSVVDPFTTAASIGWNDPTQGLNILPAQLIEDQVASWTEWTSLIDKQQTAQTNVSIRRILRAVSERKEPEDTLIDAVIVWENLFGSAQETTLRVTTSVAWMLGADVEKRKALADELRKIYNHRSYIVHGNAGLKTSQTGPYARRAIEISIELLRTVFKDHPELLKLKDGAARSTLVLLDALESSGAADGPETR